METLSAIQITEKGNLRVRNECRLKIMPAPEFYQSLTVTDIQRCNHISYVKPNKIWVSDWKITILTNTSGDILYALENFGALSNSTNGSHTVNSESELIYIDGFGHIKKLSTDMKTITTFIDTSHLTGHPRCLYWSAYTDDLIVGWNELFSRYTKTGQLTNLIYPINKNGEKFYINNGNYVTENNNGDIVVSDSITEWPGAVVVFDFEGKHRFSYRGHSPKSKFVPQGICVDPLSHILVCDLETKTVQIIDKNGSFLSNLLTRPSALFTPKSLKYDFDTNQLWVGSSYNNTVCVLRYLSQQDVLLAGSTKVLSKIQHKGTHGKNTSVSTPTILQWLTLKCVRKCVHISCVTTDRVWISDDDCLILTNKSGDNLHCLQWIVSAVSPGCHTVNRKGELIYIQLDIKKLSKDLKTTTLFIEKANLLGIPRCMYCSLITEDLLIAIKDTDDFSARSKVVRYNQRGQLTQTIQHDNTGLDLFGNPRYITENKNGDIVVSDFDAVVVTDSDGRYRFTYTGQTLESGIQTEGICTNSLFHILICDTKSKTVHIIDKDGKYLSNLIMGKLGIFAPHSLGYNATNDTLWVGSKNRNWLCVYSYRPKQELTDVQSNSSTSNDKCLADLQIMPFKM